jgi:hypothetical protein
MNQSWASVLSPPAATPPRAVRGVGGLGWRGDVPGMARQLAVSADSRGGIVRPLAASRANPARPSWPVASRLRSAVGGWPASPRDSWPLRSESLWLSPRTRARFSMVEGSVAVGEDEPLVVPDCAVLPKPVDQTADATEAAHSLPRLRWNVCQGRNVQPPGAAWLLVDDLSTGRALLAGLAVDPGALRCVHARSIYPRVEIVNRVTAGPPHQSLEGEGL